MNLLSSCDIQKIAIALAALVVINPLFAQAPREAARAPEASIPAPAFPAAIRLYPKVAPGSEGTAQVELWEEQQWLEEFLAWMRMRGLLEEIEK